jgi:acetyl-CoA carboxylase carboxyltransferase component
VASLKKAGKVISPDEENQLLEDITAKYNEELSPYYAAARLWVDDVIDPRATRKAISMGIAAANHSPITERFNVGIIQT